MKTKTMMLLVLLTLGVLLGQEAQAYYNPSTGRWLSRDPRIEQGFRHSGSQNYSNLDSTDPNLYGFLKADSISRHDVLGLEGYFQKLWCTYHPCCCPGAFQAALDVIKLMEGMYGKKGNDNDTKENAIKHCTWMCTVTSLKACASWEAHSLGWAHEADDDEGWRSHLMDLENNSVGILYGITGAKDMMDCFSKCAAAAEGGNGNPLVWIRATR